LKIHFDPKRLAKRTFVEGGSNISLWYITIRIELVSSIHRYKANRTSFIIARLPAHASRLPADASR